MSKATITELDAMVAKIQQSKKYRSKGICDETIRDLLIDQLRQGTKDYHRAAREKLHHVVATYLGDPNYSTAITELESAFCSRHESKIREACINIMIKHASTRERLIIINEFYPTIFSLTGDPATLLDIACGLNPLSFPWMGLPNSTQYYAYDLNRQRVEFLNSFFRLLKLSENVRAQDVLVQLPTETADLAFILKEIHRFERRRTGSTLRLLDALDVRHVVVSFPTKNLSGRRNLVPVYTTLLNNIVKRRPWVIKEIKFANEFVFILDKCSSIHSFADQTTASMTLDH